MDSFAQPDAYARLSEPKLTGAKSKVVAAIGVCRTENEELRNGFWKEELCFGQFS
jgi:hypothetical protein